MEWKLSGETISHMKSVFQILSPCMDNYLYVLDIKNNQVYISPNAVERFDLPGTEFGNIIDACRRFVYADEIKYLFPNEDEMEGMYERESRWFDRNNQPVWVNIRGVFVPDEEGMPSIMVGCLNEIGKEQKADNISGLRRESALLDMLTGEWVASKGFLMRIGIDNFKEINENHGRVFGDEILRQVASCIESVILPGQYTYKIVADEFIVADLSGRGIDEAKELYRRIEHALKRYIRSNMYKVFFTVSAGIMSLEGIEGNSYDHLMKLTEFALNHAKDNGKNQYYIFEQDDYNEFCKKRELMHELRKAVNQNFEGFEAYFQPIMNIKENCLCSAETLLRYKNPEGRYISPVEIVPILEESGLIIPVGRYVLEQAVKVCCDIKKTIPNFRVSVNLSYIQVMKSNALADILEIVDRYNLPKNSLMIEITESGFLEDSPKFERLCKGLKENGIMLALDDFGSGYSNFRYLFSLNPDALKVDRTFTVKAIENEKEHMLLKQMVDMSHSIDLKMCIEGVETLDELEIITELNPDYIQGYYFGKPAPIEQFMDLHVYHKAG